MEIILILLLLIAGLKCVAYKLSTMAILLYFVERGIELPDTQTLQKYREKVMKKMLHIKED